MTPLSSSSSAVAPPLLPPNLYDLSPTIHKWCALRCADIVSLTTRGVYFEDKLIHHYLNHPIRYIKLIGLIVSIDTFARRRVYTIDDSSGVCIECVALLPLPSPGDSKALPSNTSSSPSISTPQIPWDEISECKVVRILGIVGSYMQVPQLQIVKMGIVGSTDVERKWWDECRGLKDPETGILGREWVVGREEMERWKRRERRRKAKEEEKRGGGRDGRAVRMKMKVGSSGSRIREDTERVGEERELARKKITNSQPRSSTIASNPTSTSNPNPSRAPHETSPNKPLPRPPIRKRFIPTVLPDLSNYDTFGY